MAGKHLEGLFLHILLDERRRDTTEMREPDTVFYDEVLVLRETSFVLITENSYSLEIVFY